MNIFEYQIKNIDQVSVGDDVVVVTERGHGVTTTKATVMRKLKTKFELEYEDGTTAEYKTRMPFGSITRFGETPGMSCSGRESLYPDNDAVRSWCAIEARKTEADRLRWEIADLAQNHRRGNAGEVPLLEVAREVARKAQQLVEMETAIYEYEHAEDEDGEG